MARRETDREDLLRDATALVERIELARHNARPSEHVTAGFRAGGEASIFFGADPVYQFDASGQLRRAFCDALLFKAVRGRLVSLRRVRRQDEVQLLRHELTQAEQQAFLARMDERLRGLAAELDRGAYKVVGQVPGDSDVLGRVKAWLARDKETTVAARPHVASPRRKHRG